MRTFEFLEYKKRFERPDASFYRVMVFEPRGIYPHGTQHVGDGFFHADEQIAFSVVLGHRWEQVEPKIPFSEFDWASPQELRLIASLILCEKIDEGYIRLYPIVRFSPFVDAVTLNLNSKETVNELRTLLLRHAAQEPNLRNEFHALTQLRGKTYDLAKPENFAFERMSEFWLALETPNFVLLRGVYALMKADMLSCHYEFCEEATISLHIALDASFSLVCRQLRMEGKSNPTSHEVAVWLPQNFNAPFGHPEPDSTDRYFHEFYDQRIMTLHPASRFGDLPYSPTMHDDIGFLRAWLRQIFAFLVLGKHDSSYLEAVRGHATVFAPMKQQ
jgi:hypothetical protein